MTGRYVLNNNSEFMNKVKEINNTSYDCIIRYGSFITPVNYKMNDCITGLIGMRCKYVKQIELPKNMESVEWNWAKATNLIENSKICIVNKLGIKIAPKNSAYYEV
jgi:hypothetical protein